MLANGNNNQVLTSRGTTLAPVWATSSGVPYTGATAQVDLGAYALKLQGITVGVGAGANPNNTAFGNGALLSNLSSAYYNNAIGLDALGSNTSGIDNTGLGAQAGKSNLVGNSNTSIGSSAMFYSTGTGFNTAVGMEAMKNTTSGSYNVSIGSKSLLINITGSNNTVLGSTADVATPALTNATAIGYGAVVDATNKIQLGNTSVTAVNTSGAITGLSFIKSLGTAAQFLKADGTVDGSTYLTSASTATTATNIAGGSGGSIPYQTAANTSAMLANGTNNQVLTSRGTTLAPVWATSSGVPYTGATAQVDLGAYDLKLQGLKIGLGGGAVSGNTSFGVEALVSNASTAYNNNAVGMYTLWSNTTGLNNTGIGAQAGRQNQTGSQNTSIGAFAMYSSTGVGSNSAVGYESLYNTSTGSNNTAIGFQSLRANVTGSNNTGLGYQSNVASGALINATAIGYGANVAVSNTIQLGNTSVTDVKTSGTITAGAVTYPKIDGTTNQVLTTNGSGALTWSTPTSGATSLAAISGSNAYGGSITSGVLTLTPADATNGGILTNGVQTITGAKTLNGSLTGNSTGVSTIAGFSANMNAQIGTTYTLSASDNGKIITLSNAAAITLTVPSLFAGFNCMIVQLGVGAVTLTVSGTTISNRSTFTKTAGTNAIATLIALTSTTFISAGDMQ
jgi:hypothetical protein